MKRFVKLAWLGPVLGLVLIHAVSAAPPKGTAPEVFSFSPGDGPAGTQITVKGVGLEKTRDVLFCVGITAREARFKVVSDAELLVTAPACYLGGASAILAILSPTGATVCMPASAREVDGLESRNEGPGTFYHVLNNGLAKSAEGIVLVEDGGVSQAPHQAPMAFVRNGGTLHDVERFSGLLIHEPRSVIQGKRGRNATFRPVQVPVITASLGIEPFVYHKPDSFDAAATAPPHVHGLQPARVQPGDILKLTGTGFSETNEVLFNSDHVGGRLVAAGFRIVSNRQLEVEVPDNAHGSGYLIVINPKGATLVAEPHDVTPYVSKSDRKQLQRLPASHRPIVPVVPDRPLIGVNSHAVVNDGGGGAIFLVDQGGLITHTGGGCLFFVKKGGRIAVDGGGQTVFYETGAEVGNANQNRKSESYREVDSLSLSTVAKKLQIIAR
jgi:hypothetical protein